jgi:hypothetical protein
MLCCYRHALGGHEQAQLWFVARQSILGCKLFSKVHSVVQGVLYAVLLSACFGTA